MSPTPGFDGPGGCDTVAPGGGWLCLWADQDPQQEPSRVPAEPDVFVKRIRVTFSPAGPSPAQVCDSHFELSYSRDGVQRTDLFDQFGCDPGSDHHAIADFTLNAHVDFDKPICARTRSSLTNQVWSPRSCMTEHRGSTSFGIG
jgi:hypothetical protein